MPTVRKIAGGTVHIRSYGRFEPNTEYDVSRDTAEYLSSRDDFVVTKDGDETPEPDAEDDPEDASGGLASLGHDELKARAEELGIADDINLRSNDSIRAGIRDHMGDDGE